MSSTTAVRRWRVTYEIRSLIDSPSALVGTGTVEVTAVDETSAWNAALTWLRDHDYRHDDRIDPVAACTDIDPIDD